MKPVKITWKSSLPKTGTEYRVLFKDLPEYVKAEWLKKAKSICPKEECKNPCLEMSAILREDGKLEDVIFQYYFDDYEEFTVNKADQLTMQQLFVAYVTQKSASLPDAYNKKTGDIMGDGEWLDAAY